MEKKSIQNLIISYGVMLGILSILISATKYLIGNHLEKSIIESILGFALIIAMVVIPINIYKKQNQGYLKLGEAIKIGLGVSVIGGIIALIYIFIFSTFIEPDFKNQILESEIEKMRKGGTPVKTMKEAAKMMQDYIMPMMYFGIIIMNLILGLIISLITGLALKKDINNFN